MGSNGIRGKRGREKQGGKGWWRGEKALRIGLASYTEKGTERGRCSWIEIGRQRQKTKTKCYKRTNTGTIIGDWCKDGEMRERERERGETDGEEEEQSKQRDVLFQSTSAHLLRHKKTAI